MWLDSDRYKHTTVLKELAGRLKHDFDNLVATGYDPTVSACQVAKYKYPDFYPNFYQDHPMDCVDIYNPQETWFADFLYYNGTISPRFAPNWKHTAEYVKQVPGILQLQINFVKPKGGIPRHFDRVDWENHDYRYGQRQNGFAICIGIDVPSSEVEKIAIKIDNEARILKNSEWLIFEGRNFEHECWNFSDQWLVMAVLDVQANHFDLQGYTDRLKSVWDQKQE